MDDRPRLAISFSGGRTSALMTKLVVDECRDTHNILITFANTGLEHEATLQFVDRCQRHFSWDVVWLEGVVTHGRRVGMRHKIVDYMTASRNGEPFEEYIKKYGIPNKGSPQCTSRLKTEVMESFLKTNGFRRGRHLNYKTAIGIRVDEFDRMSSKAQEQGLIYPLVAKNITKEDVLKFWRSMPFDLELPGEHYGNCVVCWKKSRRKLMTIAKEAPQFFEFPARMEALYSGHKAKNGRRVFYRGNNSALEVVEQAKLPFTPYTDAQIPFDEELDVGSACGESCEIGADS